MPTLTVQLFIVRITLKDSAGLAILSQGLHLMSSFSCSDGQHRNIAEEKHKTQTGQLSTPVASLSRKQYRVLHTFTESPLGIDSPTIPALINFYTIQDQV